MEVPESQIVCALDNRSVVIQGQAKILETMQTKQGDFVSRLGRLEEASRTSWQRRMGPPRDKASVECYRFHQRGHYAKEYALIPRQVVP